MEQDLINKLSEWELTFVKIPDNELLEIYDIFFKNIFDNKNKSDTYLFYLAVYYEYQIKNLELAEKYYLII